MKKKLFAILLAATLLLTGVITGLAAIGGEGDIDDPATVTPPAIIPLVTYKDGVFTVTQTGEYTVKQIGYALYSNPVKASSLPLLEGHLPLVDGGNGSFTTSALNTEGVKSGRYVLRYWVECKGSRSIDIVNLDQPSPRNTVYKEETIRVSTKKVNSSALNKAFGTIMVVKENGTVVYADSKRKEPAATFDAGTVVEVLSKSSGNYRLKVNKNIYYVKTDYLASPASFAKNNPQEAIPALACEYALELRGSTYVYGGRGNKVVNERLVFDCSGLTYYVYNKAGLTWSRHAAYTQANHAWFNVLWRGNAPEADPVAFNAAFSALQPGDLLFYQTSNSPSVVSRRYITHCGIYIGNGKMVHAGDPVHVEDVTSFMAPVAGEVANNRIRAITRLKPYSERLPEPASPTDAVS